MTTDIAASADNDFEFLRDMFLAESEEGFATIATSLTTLAERPDDGAAMGELFRMVHTMKGSASMMGIDAVTEFAHLLEVALDHFRKGRAPLTPDRLAAIRESVDVLHALLAGAPAAKVRDSDRALVARMTPPELREADSDDDASRSTSGADGVGEHPPIKIDLNKLDALLALTRDISRARAQLMCAMGPELDLAAIAASAIADMDRLLDELQTQVTRLRLVPLGSSFRHHVRAVQDMAAVASKLARLEIEGEEMEVDATIVDHLRDALTHLLSNAVDPGLEYPAVRMAAGKDPCGTIRLRMREEGGSIIIEVADDGNGRELSAADAALAAVQRDVELLHGTLSVSSQRGVGTTVTLRVPHLLVAPAVRPAPCANAARDALATV
jgi:two-component system chemotaxis sensor kinase CheA